MPKRRKDKDPVPVMPQQYTWKTVAKFNTFEEAEKEINPYLDPALCQPVKIKRRKNSFDIRVGTPIKKD